MSTPRFSVVDSGVSGHWRVFVQPWGQPRTDVTYVRGIATQITSLSTKDPFGPAAATLRFPSVTLLDAVGTGDLDWCVPEANVDIAWVAPDEDDAQGEAVYTWEGFFASDDYGEDGSLSITCAGALHQLDNYLAKPEYLYQPLPYEQAIARQFDAHPDSRLGSLRGLDYGAAVPVAEYQMGPLTSKDAAGDAWKGRGIPAPVKVPTTTSTPYRTVVIVDHGFTEGDGIRIYGSLCKSTFSNNGVFSVVRVLDDDRFLVNMPTGGVEEEVLVPGMAVLRRPTMFPSWWTTKFNSGDKTKYPTGKTYLLPTDLANGQEWTGMLTRDTGKFEPALSNYVQGLLANMHTARGQFTLMLDPGRVPYLTHREHLHAPDAATLVVDALWPGVKFSQLSRDFTQRIGVVYIQGRATNGDVYTGMQVTADGSSTWYDPAAFRRQVHPLTNNRWLDPGTMRKEVMLAFSDGLDEQEGQRAARDHMQRFADPGLTGSLNLGADPQRGGVRFPRQAITAGMSIQVKGLFGRPEGVLFHITEHSVDAESNVTLTVDSLYRDHLTVDQVRKRGRDSLVPYRMLSTAGTYDPKIPDLLYPWSYAKGAGVIPYGGAPLFTKYGPSKVPRGSVSGMFDVPFPWTEYTTAYPPRKHPGFYAKVAPADHTNANLNWSNAYNAANTAKFKPHFVQLAAAGEIKLLQVAAYDRDGNVKKVPFHISLWYTSGISFTHMPMINSYNVRTVAKAARAEVTGGSTTFSVVNLPKGHDLEVGEAFYLNSSVQDSQVDGWFTVVTKAATSVTATLAAPAAVDAHRKVTVYDPSTGHLEFPYDNGQYYPFFPTAWEKILPDGRLPMSYQSIPAAGGSALVGYGTGYEKAGFWPGSSSDLDPATGMLSDEGGFSFDFRGTNTGLSGIDQRKSAAENMKTPSRVRAYVMIYCDADPDDPTYFLGRAFRKEYQPS